MLCTVNFSGLVKAKNSHIYKGSNMPVDKIINQSLFSCVQRRQFLLPVDFDTTVGEVFTALLLEVSCETYKKEVLEVFSDITDYSHAVQVYNSMLSDIKGNFISLTVEQLSQTITDYCGYEDKNFTDLHVAVDFVWSIKKTIKTEFTAIMENYNG